MTLTLFDIVILTIVSISSLFGLYKGMIQIVINFLGFVASIFVAILLYPKVKVVFSSYFNKIHLLFAFMLLFMLKFIYFF